MKQWRCKVCGYIAVGSEPPETCPVCGVSSEYFEEIVAESAPAVMSAEEHRRLQGILFAVPCGLFVVTASRDGRPNGNVNNSAFWITDSPLQMLLGMDKQHLTTDYIKSSGAFAVNFLQADQSEMVKRFGYKSGREVDKFEGFAWRPGITGSPVLTEAGGFLECRIRPDRTMDAGTHLVLLAEVVAGECRAGIEPLTYQEYRRSRN